MQQLTRGEFARVMREARRRWERVLRDRPHASTARNGCAKNERSHQVGCAGELVAHRDLGIPWRPAGQREIDVAGAYEVRATTRRTGELLVPRLEKVGVPLISVELTYDLTRGVARGWLFPEEVWGAARARWMTELEYPAWGVTRDKLRPLTSLPGLECVQMRAGGPR